MVSRNGGANTDVFNGLSEGARASGNGVYPGANELLERGDICNTAAVSSTAVDQSARRHRRQTILQRGEVRLVPRPETVVQHMVVGLRLYQGGNFANLPPGVQREVAHRCGQGRVGEAGQRLQNSAPLRRVLVGCQLSAQAASGCSADVSAAHRFAGYASWRA